LSTTLSWEIDGKAWPDNTASRFVDSGGLRWHVQIAGSGPDLILVHGTGASTHTWRACRPQLQDYFRVISFDLPGHGFTSVVDESFMSLSGQAEAVKQLLVDLEREVGADPALIVGHSAGAAIAMRVVLNGGACPLAVVSLNGALLPLPAFGLLTVPMMFKAIFSNPFAAPFATEFARGTGNIRRAIANTGTELSDDGYAFYERLFEDRRHVSAALNMMAQWDLAPLRRDLGQLKVPLTAVFGDNDLAIPRWQAEELSSLLPETKVIELAGCGHIAQEEAPDTVSRLLVEEAKSVGLIDDASDANKEG